MKKLVKIFAVVLAVLMLGSAMVACDKGNTEAETTAETAAATISVTIIVKDATGKTVYNDTVANTTKTTLGEVLDIFAAYQGEDVECVFDSATGLLTKLGTVEPKAGEAFTAYDESQGKDKAFSSIKDQVLTDGQTVVVAIIKL